MSEVNATPESSQHSDIETPEMLDFIQRRMKEIKNTMNCVSIGTIQSFNATTQTAEISINYRKVLKSFQPIGSNESADLSIPYPLLVSCPVFVLNGGTGSLTMPVAAGDTCIVLFCDREMDTWFSTGVATDPQSERAHDLNDALALVGIHSLANSMSNYSSDSVKLSHGSAYVEVKDGLTGGIKLYANMISLKVALDTLCTALLAWVDTNSDTPNTATKSAITSAKTLIDTVLM